MVQQKEPMQATPPVKTTGRGGARPGAGRKPGSGKGFTEKIQFCGTPEQAMTFKTLGGADWARDMLDKSLAIVQGKSRPVVLNAAPGRQARIVWLDTTKKGWRKAANRLGDGAFFALVNPDDSLEKNGLFKGDILLFVRKNEGGPANIVLADILGKAHIQSLNAEARLGRAGDVVGILAASLPQAQ